MPLPSEIILMETAYRTLYVIREQDEQCMTCRHEHNTRGLKLGTKCQIFVSFARHLFYKSKYILKRI